MKLSAKLFIGVFVSIPSKMHILELYHVTKLQDFHLISFVSKANQKLMNLIWKCT